MLLNPVSYEPQPDGGLWTIIIFFFLVTALIIFWIGKEKK